MLKGSELKFKFWLVSSILYSLTGFIVVGKTNICGDPHRLQKQGDIHSPNYPLPYPNNISCSWTILTPPNMTLTISLKDLDIEDDPACDDSPCCVHNWLSIPTDNSDRNKPLCGRNSSLKPIIISKNQTTIKFYSSKSTGQSHRGFFLSYYMGCQTNEFQCKDGKCLPGTMKCDRVAQCNDQSDEIGCQDNCKGVGKVSCGPQPVADCFDNKTQRCNGINDCTSGRDELACENLKCDLNCHSGACYTRSQACDNHTHCHDFTDEINCGLCPQKEQVLCGTKTSHCFTPNKERCDGICQCPNGEDEVGCVPDCNGGILCTNGIGCYSILSRCDSKFDCSDGSDEVNCTWRLTVDKSCFGDHRLCNNAKCVHHTFWCDGNDDCGDNSDEENCIRNSVISATIMGCLISGLLLVLAVLCTLRMYTKRTMNAAPYALQLPAHIATRLSMTHSISLPALIDDEFFHREPPPAYSVAVGQPDCSIPCVPVHSANSGRRSRTRRQRQHTVLKPPTPPPSSDTSNRSSPSRDSVTSTSYLSNDDNINLLNT